MHALFAVWTLSFLYAAVRGTQRAWIELSVFAAVLYGLLPVLNAWTTQRHLGASLAAGDHALAGFDLTAIATAAFFGWLARTLHRKQRTLDATARPPRVALAEGVR